MDKEDKPKEFELVEEGAKDSPTENIKWYGKEGQTDEKLIHDKGVGQPILIRLFEFKFPPSLETLPSREQLLTPEYVKHLHGQLWGDGLRMVMEPRVHIEKEGCKIFVPCQASTGNSFLEEPKLLQEWIR